MTRSQTRLAVIVLGAGVGLAAILGLFAYMSLTATPLHPDAARITSVTRAAPSSQWTSAVEQARQIVRAGIIEQNLPGVSVAVSVKDDIVWAEGFGLADLENRANVTPETRFRMGEVSTALTSAAVGRLLEQQKLNLDAEIQTYVPDFPRKAWPVTLRQIMGHMSGLRTDAGDEEPLSEHCEQTADGLERFSRSALLFEPGSQSRVSSYGWILVSAAVEAAAAAPFFPYMQKQIFDPLGMDDTRPDSATESIPDRATFYYPRFAGDNRYGPELAREGDYACFAGAAAFLSTPSDLARFGIAIGTGKLLKPATVATLQAPQRLNSGQPTDYGLGWKVETVPLAGEPARMASHGTKHDFIGGTTSLLTFPERGIVVAVTTNVSFADTRSLGLTVAEAFAGQK